MLWAVWSLKGIQSYPLACKCQSTKGLTLTWKKVNIFLCGDRKRSLIIKQEHWCWIEVKTKRSHCSTGSRLLSTPPFPAHLDFLIYKWNHQTGRDISTQVNHAHVMALSLQSHQSWTFICFVQGLPVGRLIDKPGNLNEHSKHSFLVGSACSFAKKFYKQDYQIALHSSDSRPTDTVN